MIHDLHRELDATLNDEIDDATRMQFEKGFLWEVALSRAFGEKAARRPGELELDGIICSPDGIGVDRAGNPLVEEYKCTAKSEHTSPADMWTWVMQAKGYCKVARATTCVFRVLHLAFVPVYKPWELTFTQKEIDENWETVVIHAGVMRRRE